MSTIDDRISQLREKMYERDIDIYVIPTSDFHESEYVGDYFKARDFITGFTGSAGTAVITMEEANLWTDGRYFLQGEAQLAGTGVILRKTGEEGVPSINEYIAANLPDEGCIGFDGRVINYRLGKVFAKLAADKGGSLHTSEDLIDGIWPDRPALSAESVMIFDEKYTGESTVDKLRRVREAMKEKGANVHLMSSLCDIAWLLNVRGNDIAYVPVVLSFLAIRETDCIWFVQEPVLRDEIKDYLTNLGIATRPYNDFYQFVEELIPTDTVLLDTSVMNYLAVSKLPETIKILDEQDPSVRMKAIKNPVQLENVINAHVKDAIAMINFMYWLKKSIGCFHMTELTVSEQLAKEREKQPGFLDLSFETIAGYNEHGAIVHYEATPETDIPIAPNGLLLVDSGGHYLEGTTDITRTFAMGPITDEMRTDFTRVCRSNLHLAHAKFLYGCSGLNLDILAREPLWEAELDYKHGTGHGVGYVLNVHEGPNGFRWKASPERSEGSVLEEGMITTDEPGLYIEGKYGIRTENEMICRKGIKNEYGQFMYFETITYVPIDLDAINPDLMSPVEKQWLNEYHQMVYEKMAPLLEPEVAEWLKIYTREI